MTVPCGSGLRGDLQRKRYEVLECIEGQVWDVYHESHGVDLREVGLAPAMRRLVTDALTSLARTRPLPALSDGPVPWEAGPDGLGDEAERHG